ncbi:MAG: DUF4255 domain-containing protein [bacterium]|nr:DUF4255 domain-containing protein [bacterium]
MISEVLLLLTSLLNEHLNGNSPAEPGLDKVVLPDGEMTDPITFKLGAVSALLINLEEETCLRPPDPYRREQPDGTTVKVQPEIRLNLYVLFAARFKQYEQGLRHLSMIIRYFQQHRVLNHQNAPALDEGVEKLTVELVTLPLSEQNEIWSALRTTYQPSVLYKVGLVVYCEEETAAPEITEMERRVEQ